MQSVKIILKSALMLCVVLGLSSVASSTTKAPPQSLPDRVNEAEVVFLGKIINKVVDGDWARAEILVEEPLKNVKKDEKIQVTWRINVGTFFIYDAANETQGVAILKDKHEGRYWLRSDKFENPGKLAEIKDLIAAAQKEPKKDPKQEQK